MRWIGGGTCLPPFCRSTCQRARRVPAPARARTSAHTRIACSSDCAQRRSRARSENASSSGKLCCGPIDSTTASSVAAACSSKSKFTQKRLRSASPKPRLTRPPNGACTTSCMPPASSKKRSNTTSVSRRHDAERGALRGDVVDDLQRAPRASSAHSLDEPRRRRRASLVVEPRRDLAAQAAHLFGQLPRARRRFAEPERHARRPPLRVLDAHDAARRLDAPDLPRVRAEQEDVARHALDRPVLVHRADERLVRVEHDAVVGDLRDRAAARERRDARRAPSPQRAVDAVAVQVARVRGRRAAPRLRSASRGPRRSPRATSVAYGVALRAPCSNSSSSSHSRAAHSATICCARMSSGATGGSMRSRRPAVHGADQRRALHELVARRREEPPARRAARARGPSARCAAGTS